MGWGGDGQHRLARASAACPSLQGKKSQTCTAPGPATKLLEPERGPLSKPRLRPAAASSGSQLYPTSCGGSAHFRGRKIDPKVARTGPPAHQLSWARTSLTADLAQLGWEWEGPRALKP